PYSLQPVFPTRRSSDLIGANVYPGRTQIARYSAGFSAGILLVNLDRQFQREPFSGTCFGHNISSVLAFSAGRSQIHTTSPGRSRSEEHTSELQSPDHLV